jgi:Predicted membrane protein (DUF2238)
VIESRRTILDDLREHHLLVIFAAAMIVGWSAYGFAIHAKGAPAYLAMMVALAAFVAFVHHRVGFSGSLLWALTIWGFLHMAGGLVPAGGAAHVLYNADWGVPVLRYDRLIHAFGFGVATVACWHVLRPRLAVGTRMTAGLKLLVALMGMGVGAVNEVVEFAASQLANTNVGGYVNTGWDLVFNTIGCASASAWIAHRERAPAVLETPARLSRSFQES